MWISRIVAATARTAKTAEQHTSSHNKLATELVTRCMFALICFFSSIPDFCVKLPLESTFT